LDDLLTTRQLQEMLQVDRITIYRMLNDGRLRGFKVGGQWRFSQREIEAWLQEQQGHLDWADSPPVPSGNVNPSSEALHLSCVQAIQGVCAEALDIGVVTTDLDGKPLTGISNSCEFCDLILSTAEGQRRCAADWQLASNGQFRTCHAGLLCSSALIEIDGQPVAITAGCQMASRLPDGDDLAALSAELSLDAGELAELASTVHLVPDETLKRAGSLLQRAAAAFSQIGQERLNLLSRLQHIAEMSKVS